MNAKTPVKERDLPRRSPHLILHSGRSEPKFAEAWDDRLLALRPNSL